MSNFVEQSARVGGNLVIGAAVAGFLGGYAEKYVKTGSTSSVFDLGTCLVQIVVAGAIVTVVYEVLSPMTTGGNADAQMALMIGAAGGVAPLLSSAKLYCAASYAS